MTYRIYELEIIREAEKHKLISAGDPANTIVQMFMEVGSIASADKLPDINAVKTHLGRLLGSMIVLAGQYDVDLINECLRMEHERIERSKRAIAQRP